MTTPVGLQRCPATDQMAFYRDLPASIPPRKCSESEIYVPETHPFPFRARRHDQGMNGSLPTGNPIFQTSPPHHLLGGVHRRTPRRSRAKGEKADGPAPPPAVRIWLNPLRLPPRTGAGAREEVLHRQVVCPEDQPARRPRRILPLAPSLPSTSLHIAPDFQENQGRTFGRPALPPPTAMSSAAAARPATPASSSRQGMFQCGLCSSQYKRLDHLSRHVRSRTLSPRSGPAALEGWAGILGCRW